MFSLKLSLTTTTSTVWFGGYDEPTIFSMYNSTYVVNKTANDLIQWMNLTSKQYWQVSMQSASVGSSNISISMTSVVFDSGASLMYIPSSDYTILYNAIF